VSLFFLFAFAFGKKPANKKLSAGKPERTRALIAALGPGIMVTGIFFSMHSFTILNPGS